MSDTTNNEGPVTTDLSAQYRDETTIAANDTYVDDADLTENVSDIPRDEDLDAAIETLNDGA